MVYLTTENSTQYFNDFTPSTKPDLGSRSFNCYGHTDIELLEKENVDFLEVSQIICRPYVILKAGKRTIHRGIKNRTDRADKAEGNKRKKGPTNITINNDSS